jgi:hypothetical protein
LLHCNNWQAISCFNGPANFGEIIKNQTYTSQQHPFAYGLACPKRTVKKPDSCYAAFLAGAMRLWGERPLSRLKICATIKESNEFLGFS